MAAVAVVMPLTRCMRLRRCTQQPLSPQQQAYLLCRVSRCCADHGCCCCSDAAHALHEIEADALGNQDGARTALNAAKLLTLLYPVAIWGHHSTEQHDKEKQLVCYKTSLY